MSSLICPHCQIPVGHAAEASGMKPPDGATFSWAEDHCWSCGRSALQIEAEGAAAPVPEEVEKGRKAVTVYVCPTPGCDNFYGSSQMPDLEAEFSGPKCEDATTLERTSGSRFKHSRAECPDCRLKGLGRVVRVRTTVAVSVPVKGPPAPKLPESTGTLATA